MGVRHYELQLIAKGPIHIGYGATLSKKGYFVTKKGGHEIAILDERQFVGQLDANQADDYLGFLEMDSKSSLQDFLDNNPGLEKLANQCVAYKLDTPLSLSRSSAYQFHDAKLFVKDSYGCPYIPGSSVKGMLRTALLAHIVSTDPSTYARFAYGVKEAAGKGDIQEIGRISGKIERTAFRPDREGSPRPSATSDIMKYVSVADSAPLSTQDLVLVKKYDLFSKGDRADHKKDMGRISRPDYYEGNELNIYRESLRPGTKFSVRIDIDDRIDQFLGCVNLDREGLCRIFAKSFGLYDEDFLQFFDGEAEDKGESSDGFCQYIIENGPMKGFKCRKRAMGGSRFCSDHAKFAKGSLDGPGGESVTCYLGGGTDFDIKTVCNALLANDPDRVRIIAQILYGQFRTRINRGRFPELWAAVVEQGFEPKEMNIKWGRDNRIAKAKEDHRHWMDPEFGVAPHAMKLGIFDKKKLPMGKCELTIKEL